MATNQLPSDGHLTPRDFRVSSITLINAAGAARDISSMVAEVQIRQDMYLGFMSGDMLVTDGVDLLAQASAHGGEYIWLHFSVPEQKVEIKKAFRIYKIGKRSPKDATQQYVVYFVSDEFFKSHTTKISRSFANSTVSGIARDIMTGYLDIPENRVFVEDTKIQTSVIIPNWRPLEALNWLASRAHTDTSSCFFFYENLAGFHFKSLQSLYKTPTPIKVPFTMENKRGAKALDMDKFSIDDYEAVRDFDTLTAVSNGAYSMRLQSINPIDQTHTNYDYSLQNLPKLYPNPPMSEIGNILQTPETHLMTYVTIPGMENWIKRVMALAALNSELIDITVPGNMGINAGMMINLRIPYTVMPTEGDIWDKRKSGKYLTIAVNHKFDMINHGFTSLALVTRDSLPIALPAYNRSLPDKIAKMYT